MLHKKTRFILIIVLIVTILTCNISDLNAQEDENIRIGLFFQTQAVSNFTISSDSGIQFVHQKDNMPLNLLDDKTGVTYVVRKDSYFIYATGKYADTTQDKIGSLQGTKIGNYHIGIGGSYKSFEEARIYSESIVKLGIPAYVAFTDTWEVWTGYYINFQEANTDITKLLTLVKADYRVQQPSDKSIVIEDITGNTKLFYANTLGTLQIKSLDGSKNILKINTKPYRGLMEVLRQKDSDMTVVNVLTVEEYVYGVVPYEIGSDSHTEALKAQAVAARTYAYNNLKKHDEYGFNLCSDIHCQVYKGVTGETQSTNKAVDATKGKKLLYNGKYAQVFYFSSSGGYTEDAVNVWGTDFPYLRSVEDEYESGKSTNYTWEKTITISKINSMIAKLSIGSLQGININKTSEAGRVTELSIKGTTGEKTVTKSVCRSIFELPSQMYTINYSGSKEVFLKSFDDVIKTSIGANVMTSEGLKPLGSGTSITVMDGNGTKKVLSNTVADGYTFSGRGWGHAVGMSQEGAKGMANEGYTYDEILKHYFQGTTVE